MGAGRRVFIYVIAALVSFFVLSCITIYQHRDILAQYFSSSLSAFGGILLYLLIFGIAIACLLRAIFV